MRAILIRTFAITMILGGAGLAFGQSGPTPPGGKTGNPPEAPAPKTKLEEMIQQAMRHNADIRVAETKVAEAEAELNRTRQVVMQKIVLYNANLDLAKAVVAEAEQRVKAMREALSKVPGAYSKEDVQSMEALLLSKKAELAKVEAELPLLLGTPANDKATDRAMDRGAEFLRRAALDLYGDPNRTHDASLELDRAAAEQWLRFMHKDPKESLDTNTAFALAALTAAGLKPPVQGPMVERIKAALDNEMIARFTGSPRKVLEQLLDRIEGVPSKIQLADKDFGNGPTVDLIFREKVPLGALIQAYQDSVSPNVRFVVRDYGILVTDDKHVPPGAPLLYDVWNGGKETRAAKTPDRVEGKIKAVDGKAKLVTVDIGSDAGIKKGEMLAVYRLDPKPAIYLGQLKVVEVKPTEAVAEFAGGVKGGDLKEGDQVTNYLR